MAKTELSLEQKISQWKKKYGEVFEIIVEDKKAYIHRPDRVTLKAAFTLATSDPLGFAEVILENCWIEGDEEIKTNDAYFLGVVGQIQTIVETKEAELKKL